MKPIIKVSELGKQYTRGAKAEPYTTLREALVKAARKPVDILRGNGKREDDRFWALKDVSFDVTPGEVVGIIGRNGAGKSTLLKILSRITEPTTGRVELFGRVGSLLEVGTGFHPELTGRENIFLNGAILGMRHDEITKKFDEIVDFAEIEAFLDTPVKRYSSGMYVRLAFAVAAHLEPEVLVVDEVLAVGDPQFQKKCLNKMKDVGQRGRTVLFVSHDMQAVSRLCDRVMWFEQGHKFHDSETRETIGLYLTANSEKAPCKEWNEADLAPGNSKVRLRSVRICNSERLTVANVMIDEAVGIEMEFEVLQDGLIASANFHLFNEHGICIFVAADWTPERKEVPMNKGKYKSVAWIPPNFLSSGPVSVTAALSSYKPFSVHFAEFDAVMFQVVESSNPGTARGDYTGFLPGVVRPNLAWELSSIRSDVKSAIY